jgi:hypothetical protein
MYAAPKGRLARIPILVSALVCSLAALPSTAHAAMPINFDSHPAGTSIDTEYTASDGVTFLHDATSTGFPDVANVGAAKASSGSNVAYSSCSGCEFVTNVIKGRFATSQEAVSVRVGVVDGDPSQDTVTLQLFNASNVLVGQTSVEASTTDFRTTLALDPAGTNNVVYFRIVAPANGWQIGIDDINATDTGAPDSPDFALSAGSTGLRVRQGGSTTLPISVLRTNGSSGDVDLTALSLPAGVTAAFGPDPVGGTSEGPSTLTLSASNSATPINNDAVTVRGVPANAFVGDTGTSHDLALDVTVEPAFRVSLPASIPVPSCGSTTTNVVVTRAFSGFSDNVNLAVSGLEAGYSATLGSTVVGAPSGGAFSNVVPLTITRTGSGDMDGTSITVTGTSGALPASADTAAVSRIAGELTDVAPALGSVPRDTGPGSEVTITGRGLCPGSQVQFGNTFASVVASGTDIGAGNTTMRVRVPRLATSGRVTVVNPDGSFSTPSAMTIRSPRNTEGFRFNNYIHNGVSFDDMKYVYGEAQTNITVDLCWPFDCDVVTPIPSPFAALYQLISNEALSGDGSCYGISITSQQLASGRIPYSRFQSGVNTVWGLSSTTGPNAALAKHIRAWHNTQLSSEAIQAYVSTAAGNALTHGSSVRGQLESELRAGRSPIIMLKHGWGGHVLVAHDVRSGPSGTYLIDVYDPNLEFLASEDTDGTNHRDRENASVIEVTTATGNWRMVGAYSGGAWTGGPGELIQQPFGNVPNRPTMPSTLEGLVSLIVPFGDATGTQVTDAGGNTLLAADGSLNTDAATGIDGAQVMPILSGDDSQPVFLVPSNGVYTQQVTGTAAGMTGPGFAGIVTGIADAGSETQAVTFDRSHGLVEVDAEKGGSMRARLARATSDSAEYGADIRIAGGDAGEHAFQLDPKGDGVEYVNGGGAASAAITLTYANEDGTPGAAQLPTVQVPAGGSVSADPQAWGRLGTTGVELEVRGKAGNVVMRRVVSPKASAKRVRSVAVSARTVRANARVAKVTVNWARVPRTAKAFVTVQVKRGTRVVAVKRMQVPAAKATGTRTYAFPLTLGDATYSLRAAAGVVTGTALNMQTSSARGSARFVAR